MRLGSRFYTLFVAFFVSSVGDWIFRLSIPIVIYHVTKSPIAMAGAYACSFIPVFIVMPFGGVIADHYDRRRILLYGDFASGVICLMLSAAVYHIDSIGYLVLYPLVLLLATATAVS